MIKINNPNPVKDYEKEKQELFNATIECLAYKKMIAKGILMPMIMHAIYNEYFAGTTTMSVQLIIDHCKYDDDSILWEKRIPIICKALRDVLECGADIISDDKDYIGFTIQFKTIEEPQNNNKSKP